MIVNRNVCSQEYLFKNIKKINKKMKNIYVSEKHKLHNSKKNIYQNLSKKKICIKKNKILN